MRSKNTRAGNQLGQHHRRHHILSKWTKVKYFSWELFVSVFLMPAVQIVTSWFSLSIIKICNNTALIGDVRLSILTYPSMLAFHWASTCDSKMICSPSCWCIGISSPCKRLKHMNKIKSFLYQPISQARILQSDITWLINSYKDSNFFSVSCY